MNDRLKSSSTKENLSRGFDINRKGIEFQFTPEMNWWNIETDHVRPISSFDVSQHEDLKETIIGKNI